MTQPSRIDGLPDLPKPGALTCTECGMLCEWREFHPFAACLMFKGCHDSDKVRANLNAVREAGSAAAAQAAKQVPAGAHTEHDELGRDEDGEISLDWQNKAGDMLSMSLGKDGRLSWAVHRAGPNGSGTAQLNTHAYRLLNDVLTECEAAAPSATSLAEAAEAGTLAGFVLVVDESIPDGEAYVMQNNKRIAKVTNIAAVPALHQAPVMGEAPTGAIFNGRALAERLEWTGFECVGGDLRLCSDWVEFRRCFEHLADFVQAAAPSPAPQAVPGGWLPKTYPSNVHGLISDAEYLKLFDEARKGSDKPCGTIRGIRAVIAAYETAAPQAVVGEASTEAAVASVRIKTWPTGKEYGLEGLEAIMNLPDGGHLLYTRADLTPTPAPSAAPHQGADALREASFDEWWYGNDGVRQRQVAYLGWPCTKELARSIWNDARAALAQHQPPKDDPENDLTAYERWYEI